MQYQFVITNQVGDSRVVKVKATSKNLARQKVRRMNPHDRVSSKLGRALQK